MIPWRNVQRFAAKAARQPGYAMRVAVKRMRAQGSYLWGSGRSPAPEAVTLFLTKLCNLHCKMCGQWGDFGSSRLEGQDVLREVMPLGDIQKVLLDLAAARPSITLFGGEPFLHPQSVEIIREVKNHRMHCLAITNATLLDRLSADVVEAGLDELNVSVDGPGSLHDEIRGMPGLFGRIAKGLSEVNRVKSRRRSKFPLVNLQCTISRFNCGRLDEMTDVAASLGADSLTFHHLIFLGKKVLEEQRPFDKNLGCSTKSWEGFVFEAGIDPEQLHHMMNKIRSRTYPFAVDFYPNLSRRGLSEYYTNPDYQPAEYKGRCQSPWICGYIFPNGDLRPCLNCSYAFGNIKNQSFMQAWNSAQAVRYRQTLKHSGIFPVCRRCTELYRY